MKAGKQIIWESGMPIPIYIAPGASLFDAMLGRLPRTEDVLQVVALICRIDVLKQRYRNVGLSRQIVNRLTRYLQSELAEKLVRLDEETQAAISAAARIFL